MCAENILIGCHVCQPASIIHEFLESLLCLKIDGMHADFLFIDNNMTGQSSKILGAFKRSGCNVDILDGSIITAEEPREKAAVCNDKIISYTCESSYDYLFLIDSDLLLHPETLNKLITQDKDIISEIYWTRNNKDSTVYPQVWLYDNNIIYDTSGSQNLLDAEINLRTSDFINKLKIPGIYKVGGLGGCILISKKTLNSGISFKRIYNISYMGVERHFSIRCAVLGFELYVDTSFPAFKFGEDIERKDLESFKKSSGYNLKPIINNPGAQAVQNLREASEEYINRLVLKSIEHISSKAGNDTEEARNIFCTEYLDSLNEIMELDNDKKIYKYSVSSLSIDLLDINSGFAVTTFMLDKEGLHDGRRFRSCAKYKTVLKNTINGWRIENIVKESEVDNKCLLDFWSSRFTEIAKCCLCGGSDSSLENIRVDGGEIRRCRTCDLLYISPRMDNQTILSIYGQGYFKGGGMIGYKDYLAEDRTPVEKVKLQLFAQFLNGVDFTGFNILDIGCADGQFLEMLKDNIGNISNLYGLEINREMAAYARRKGFEIENSELKDSRFDDEFFDIITMWDILEHYANPLEELQLVNKKLDNRHGYVLISTHNYKKSIIKQQSYEGYFSSLEHLYYFDSGTLSKLLSKCGFIVSNIFIYEPGKSGYEEYGDTIFICAKKIRDADSNNT